MGASFGVRTELAIVISGSAAYLFYKTRSFLRSIIGVFIQYCIIFIWASTPFVLSALYGLFSLPDAFSDSDFLKFFMLLSFFGMLAILYIVDNTKFMAIISDMRYMSIIHYLLMFLVGLYIADSSGFQFYTEDNLLDFILFPLSLSMVILASIISNNIADHDIDRVSNRQRPHIKGCIKSREYKAIGWLSLAAGLILASVVSLKILFLMLVFKAGYFLYSMLPIRFKRVIFLSKLVVGINSGVMVLVGYILVRSSLLGFPEWILPILVAIFTMASQFLDIKDYQGDRTADIMTLPVLLGLKWGKLVIGILFLCSALLVNLIIHDIYIFFGSIICGLVGFVLINLCNYRHFSVFLWYQCCTIAILIYLIL